MSKHGETPRGDKSPCLMKLVAENQARLTVLSLAEPQEPGMSFPLDGIEFMLISEPNEAGRERPFVPLEEFVTSGFACTEVVKDLLLTYMYPEIIEYTDTNGKVFARDTIYSTAFSLPNDIKDPEMDMPLIALKPLALVCSTVTQEDTDQTYVSLFVIEDDYEKRSTLFDFITYKEQQDAMKRFGLSDTDTMDMRAFQYHMRYAFPELYKRSLPPDEPIGIDPQWRVKSKKRQTGPVLLSEEVLSHPVVLPEESVSTKLRQAVKRLGRVLLSAASLAFVAEQEAETKPSPEE